MNRSFLLGTAALTALFARTAVGQDDGDRGLAAALTMFSTELRSSPPTADALAASVDRFRAAARLKPGDGAVLRTTANAILAATPDPAIQALTTARCASQRAHLLPAVRALQASLLPGDPRLAWLEGEIAGAGDTVFSPGDAVAALQRASLALETADTDSRERFAAFVGVPGLTPDAVRTLAALRSRQHMAGRRLPAASPADFAEALQLDRFRHAADVGDQRAMARSAETLLRLRPEQPLYAGLLGMVLSSLGPVENRIRGRALLHRRVKANSPTDHIEVRAIWERVGFRWPVADGSTPSGVDAIRQGAHELLVELRTTPHGGLVFPDREALAAHEAALRRNLGSRERPRSLLAREADLLRALADRAEALELARARLAEERQRSGSETGPIRGVRLSRLASDVQDRERELRRRTREWDRLEERIASIRERIERCAFLETQYSAARAATAR